MPRRFIHSGDLLGYISAPGEKPIVRAVVEQKNAGFLETGLHRAQVRLAARRHIEIPAELVRDYPAGTLQLPSQAMSKSGGGALETSADDPTGRVSVAKVFQLDFALPVTSETIGIGERAYIRLDHGTEALWRRWSRRIYQLFLGIA